MSYASNDLQPTIARPPGSRGVFGWLQLWFLLQDPVSRRDYALSGLGLMALKYGVEALVIYLLTARPYSPLDFLSPLLSTREHILGRSPLVALLWVLWAVPFLWIAVSMSVRRALDAGVSPWHGLWVLVPIVNIFGMLALAILPTGVVPMMPNERPTQAKGSLETAPAVWSVIGGIAVGALYASVVIQATTYALHDYGAVLFFGTPFVTGVASSFMLNRRVRAGYAASTGVALAALFFSSMLLLLFAAEGAICIAMAAPIMAPLGMLGAPIGKWLADNRADWRDGLVGGLVVVPLWATIDSRLLPANEFVVTSSVDIAAPPDVVWKNVISFPDIDERPEWFFRWGVSCPQGARIAGQGVGAVRECIFSTGRFVEPITTWDAPHRLAFDVREQPAPLFELSPYRNLHPPHLDHAFRSTHGEFELIELADGGTRLVGRTWYTLEIRPLSYWTIWSDQIVHRIHERVLVHIKRIAENK